MAALGILSMFLPTPYGGASIEWVNQGLKLNKVLLSIFVSVELGLPLTTLRVEIWPHKMSIYTV